MVCHRLFRQAETTIHHRRRTDINESGREEGVDRASCTRDTRAILVTGTGVRLYRFLDDHVFFMIIGIRLSYSNGSWSWMFASRRLSR